MPLLHSTRAHGWSRRLALRLLLAAAAILPLLEGCGYVGIGRDGEDGFGLGGAGDDNSSTGGKDSNKETGGQKGVDEHSGGSVSGDGGGKNQTGGAAGNGGAISSGGQPDETGGAPSDGGNNSGGAGESGGNDSGGSDSGGGDSGGGAGSGGADSGGAGGSDSGGAGGSDSGGSDSGGADSGGGDSGGGAGGSDSGGSDSGGSDSGGGDSGGGAGGSGGSDSEGCSSGEEFAPPELIDTLDVNGEKMGPSISGDGLALYFSVQDEGVEKVYRAYRPDRHTPFGPALEVVELNEADSQGSPFINFDETRVYFFAQSGASVNSRDLYSAERSDTSSPFGAVTRLGLISSNSLDVSPWLSPDEHWLYLASSRSNGGVSTDIWFAERNSGGVLTGLTELASPNSDEYDEMSPSLTADLLTLYFTSNRPPLEVPDGLFHVWRVTRSSASETFGTPVLVESVSSGGNDTSVNLSPDGQELFLSSDRLGGSHELWVAQRCSPSL